MVGEHLQVRLGNRADQLIRGVIVDVDHLLRLPFSVGVRSRPAAVPEVAACSVTPTRSWYTPASPCESTGRSPSTPQPRLVIIVADRQRIRRQRGRQRQRIPATPSVL